jgi:dTMP kinase
MSYKGRFIAIEGLEGAGKSTAITLIKEHLQQNGINEIITTREPGGTKVAEKLRSIIKGEVKEEPLLPQTELLLLYSARVQLVNHVIIPALKKGTWVIADRFELSTYAYQGGGRGVATNIIDQLSNFCLQGLTPDLTLYMDIDPEVGFKRIETRGVKDRIERESLQFFKRIRDEFLQRIKQDSNAVIIDANAELSQVSQAITHSLEVFLSQLGEKSES